MNVSLDKINLPQEQKVHFLERNLEKETTSLSNENQDNSSYISKNQNKESIIYQHYENGMNIKFNRPEEMTSKWKEESLKKNVDFINSENANFAQPTHYANYISPERFNPEKFAKEKKAGKTVGVVEMKYESKH